MVRVIIHLWHPPLWGWGGGVVGSVVCRRVWQVVWFVGTHVRDTTGANRRCVVAHRWHRLHAWGTGPTTGRVGGTGLGGGRCGVCGGAHPGLFRWVGGCGQVAGEGTRGGGGVWPRGGKARPVQPACVAWGRCGL